MPIIQASPTRSGARVISRGAPSRRTRNVRGAPPPALMASINDCWSTRRPSTASITSPSSMPASRAAVTCGDHAITWGEMSGPTPRLPRLYRVRPTGVTRRLRTPPSRRSVTSTSRSARSATASISSCQVSTDRPATVRMRSPGRMPASSAGESPTTDPMTGGPSS